MKIIGAGFGRTGTYSLKVALEELGFDPCYHMAEVFENPDHIPTWAAAVAGQPVDWQAFFADYQATVDWPGCEFYRELMEIYPEAKVLLSVRDPEKWYASARETIYPFTKAMPSTPFFMYLIWPRLRDMLPMIEVIEAMIWQGRFRGQFEDRQQAMEIFNKHIEEVKAYVPADRLLVYSVKEGWEPLCQFLEVPVPEGKSFPHENDKESYKKRIRLFGLFAWLIPATALGLSGLIIAVLYFWRRR